MRRWIERAVENDMGFTGERGGEASGNVDMFPGVHLAEIAWVWALRIFILVLPLLFFFCRHIYDILSVG